MELRLEASCDSSLFIGALSVPEMYYMTILKHEEASASNISLCKHYNTVIHTFCIVSLHSLYRPLVTGMLYNSLSQEWLIVTSTMEWLIVTSTMEWCNTSVLCIIVWSIIIQCNIASRITVLITGGCTMEWTLFCNNHPLTHITAMLMSNWEKLMDTGMSFHPTTLAAIQPIKFYTEDVHHIIMMVI